jgi:hypothetical protein
MVDTVEWHSLGVMSAEGMSLRVGAFKASDGEVVEFSNDVLKKIFSKVRDPVPMYLTHKDAGTGQARVVMGHAVKLGLELDGNKIHYKALMMDPEFKMMYASGYDDTSAEIDPIRDEATGKIIDGTLTGIAVVPNPAISGTQMKVAAVAFSAPETGSVQYTAGTTSSPYCNSTDPVVEKSKGVIKLTGTKIERMLLENGVPSDKVAGVIEASGAYFSKQFEHEGLQKKFEEQSKALELACSSEKDMKKKFEDLNKEFEIHLSGKVGELINEVTTIGFANPGAVIEGLPVQQKIAMLSKIKENMIAAKPASAPSIGLTASPPVLDVKKQFEKELAELGCAGMWDEVHAAPKQGA